jgi:DNA adenine methylase
MTPAASLKIPRSKLRLGMSASPSPSGPFLRWAGSKRKLVPVLRKFAPNEFERYVEPFAGSACFFFDLRPARAILGDINHELMATYREIKWRVDDVIAALEPLKPSRDGYYRVRGLDLDKLTASERAARFIYLNRFCFNGLYRTNRAGEFNVPYGAARSGHLPSREALRAASVQLKKVRLKSAHFVEVLKDVSVGDFVYMDPPYSVKSRRVFKEYSAEQFSQDDLVALKSAMHDLDRRGIRFLVSYAASREGDYLREDFSSSYVDVPRHIAGFVGNRRSSREVLIHNG